MVINNTFSKNIPNHGFLYLIKIYKEQEPLKRTYCNDQFKKLVRHLLSSTYQCFRLRIYWCIFIVMIYSGYLYVKININTVKISRWHYLKLHVANRYIPISLSVQTILKHSFVQFAICNSECLCIISIRKSLICTSITL